jgi:hypothetical protein
MHLRHHFHSLVLFENNLKIIQNSAPFFFKDLNYHRGLPLQILIPFPIFEGAVALRLSDTPSQIFLFRIYSAHEQLYLVNYKQSLLIFAKKKNNTRGETTHLAIISLLSARSLSVFLNLDAISSTVLWSRSISCGI